MRDKKQEKSKSVKREGSGGRAYYFDQYSRKVYYDEEVMKLQQQTRTASSPRDSQSAA